MPIPQTKEELIKYESESVDSTLLKAIALLLIDNNKLLEELVKEQKRLVL